MLNYTMKSHKNGRIYTQPHFYIQNKGLNSGRALNDPIANCFVVLTESIKQREALYYLCQSLQIGEYFKFHIIGSVIPFIRIDDTRQVINTALRNYEQQNWELKVQNLLKITVYENNLQEQLRAIKLLKLALLRA